MKYVMTTVAALSLAACGGGTSATTADICNEMVKGDAEAAAEIAGDGIEVADLCACIGKTVDAMPEAQKAAHVGVMTAVTALRTASSMGVEEAAELLEDQLRDGTGGYTFTEDDFQATGQLLGEVGDQVADGGSCKAG